MGSSMAGAARKSVLTLHPHRFGAMPRDARARARGGGQGAGAGAAIDSGAAVVIRLPDRMAAPYEALIPRASPRLYVHEGARQALERRLEAASLVPVSLAITDNRHSIISHSWQGGMLRARVHHMFLDAPLAIQHALVRYVTEADRDASVALGSFIESRSDRLARRAGRRTLTTTGEHHDLLALYSELNERYFGGTVHALITWGRQVSRPGPRVTIKLGSYDEHQRLIRINPALDKPWVPRYFIAFIVFHEMLHHVVPARRLDARRALHPPEFRERERTFRHYERALRWEQKNLGRLLRS
jgi:hypothetical protein